MRPIVSARSIILLFLVAFAAAPACADYLGGITFSYPSPSFLPHDQVVTATVHYKVTEAGGGRIFILPFTNGAPTPNLAVSGGPLVSGTGSVNLNLRITAGEHLVDQVRLRLASPDQSETWLQMFVPVYFAYGPNAVYNLEFNRTEHSSLRRGRQFFVDFDYDSSDPAGCRILARPFTNGSLTPGYLASGSAVLPQSGSYSQWFSFSNDADVTHIRLQVLNHDSSQVLFEEFLAYPLHWREVGIYDITFDHHRESSLASDEDVVASFTVDHMETGDVYVWAIPSSNGDFPIGGAYEPSTTIPSGIAPLSRFFNVHGFETMVDEVRFVARVDGVSTEFSIPVRLLWSPHAIQDPVFTPASPAALTNGEHLLMTFDYATDEPGGVRIYARPALDYVQLPAAGGGSILYPAPSGNGSHNTTFSSGQWTSDSVRFWMTNADQSQTLLTFFKHGLWAWGSPATLTPAPEPVAPLVAAALGPVYPNPFNPQTVIPLDLAEAAHVRLGVYDVRGRLVEMLVDGPLDRGRHDLRFDGAELPSGTYLCRLDGPGGVQTQRMTLVR